MVKILFKAVFAAIGVLFASASILRANLLVPGFSESAYVVSPSSITGIAWAPDDSNRLFIILKGGTVRIAQNGTLLPTGFATIAPVYTASECGLIGIAFDPNYVVNRYVYFFVTVSNTEQQIIRYTDSANIGTSKTTVIAGLPTVGANHDGGGVGFGFDGKLYWSIGDLGNGTGVDANLSNLASKIGRANLNGTAYRGNPFYDGAGPQNDFIWARGFRNPFTLTFHPSTGDLWVNVAGTSYEQIFLVKKGEHAGWNDFEANQPGGYIRPKIKYRTNNTDQRSLTATGAVRNGNVVTFTTTATHFFLPGEKITIAGVPDSSFNGSFYVRSVPSNTSFTVSQAGPDATSGPGTATTQQFGGAVTGGCFYDSTAFTTEYRTNFFFCDYNSGRLNRVVLDANSEVLSVDYFANNYNQATDVATGPDGALYCASIGGTIYRIASTNAGQRIIVSRTGINMAEGGQAMFTVRLFENPTTNVTVTIAHVSGDSGITTTNTTLVFGAGNYTIPQGVRVFAAVDGDAQADQATFSVSSPVAATETVFVNAYDVFADPPVLSVLLTNGNARIRLEGGQERTHILQGTTSFLSWSPLATNFTRVNI